MCKSAAVAVAHSTTACRSHEQAHPVYPIGVPPSETLWDADDMDNSKRGNTAACSSSVPGNLVAPITHIAAAGSAIADRAAQGSCMAGRHVQFTYCSVAQLPGTASGHLANTRSHEQMCAPPATRQTQCPCIITTPGARHTPHSRHHNRCTTQYSLRALHIHDCSRATARQLTKTGSHQNKAVLRCYGTVQKLHGTSSIWRAKSIQFPKWCLRRQYDRYTLHDIRNAWKPPVP